MSPPASVLKKTERRCWVTFLISITCAPIRTNVTCGSRGSRRGHVLCSFKHASISITCPYTLAPYCICVSDLHDLRPNRYHSHVCVTRHRSLSGRPRGLFFCAPGGHGHGHRGHACTRDITVCIRRGHVCSDAEVTCSCVNFDSSCVNLRVEGGGGCQLCGQASR